MPQCLLALGANLGDALSTLMQSAKAIGVLPGVRLQRVSRLIESAPVGGPADQPRFTNGAATIETELPPHELLHALHEVEQRFGRQRRDRWEARTLDIDLLLYGDRASSENGVQTPHPRMTFRPFVMIPAAEIAGETTHPLLGRPLGELDQLRAAGANKLAVLGGPSWLVELARGCVGANGPEVVTNFDPDALPPRLSVINDNPAPLIGAGPTLWTPEDAPHDALRQDLTAAIQCVWPGLG
ncbi:2-amino-4-hydroxy-6-hydroxymethyldihydropteridine pyrophosphokinase [Posidoniimonas polymericola]|uniref:2-amino-4-hydroxy-6-hydroxymethyldihydropteridine pyrophosphokinase n=1 Tax=Posidoniimonas polymericola TaxID=2528002 RepID=A0A5C5ZE14_9BACT|nr:2-amino-4-hydroxy-6-hydroxymethyldihydropteridine diphosphokinase [Posidoniimonas polymericola]TWT85400.1 2-amino-4-hydroxy-6-hydroxymethyldihydropteridine pyrophosphokinase [Posidoniimonas polymericola]